MSASEPTAIVRRIVVKLRFLRHETHPVGDQRPVGKCRLISENLAARFQFDSIGFKGLAVAHPRQRSVDFTIVVIFQDHLEVDGFAAVAVSGRQEFCHRHIGYHEAIARQQRKDLDSVRRQGGK